MNALRTRLLVALSAALLATGCEEPKQGTASETKTTAAGKRYSEPGLKGRIVDATTGRPLPGAIVYGYYLTTEGTLAGGRRATQGVKAFATTSDAQGVFKLEPWDSGDTLVKGEPGLDFPMISVYKPGYLQEHQNLASIAQWQPRNLDAKAATVGADNVYDWTAIPHLMLPATNEIERFTALDNSTVGMMTMGECGWETYAPLLLAQHHELRDWMRRNIPPEEINADGTLKPNFPYPRGVTFGGEKLFKQTRVEQILKRYATEGAAWRCADPNTLFGQRK